MRAGVRIAVLALLGFCLVACASKPDPVLPEDQYYQLARKAMRSGNFAEAERNLQFLESYYPFGRYAEQAQVDLIYARYQNMELDGARIAADRFLRLHPQSAHADYALYLKGIASYNLDVTLAGQYFPIELSARDPGEQVQAFRDFSELVTRFPDSAYAADARKRMEAIRNRLAELEVHVARYYIKRQAFLAAANRARYVLENFPKAPAQEDALIILTETYRKLGLPNEAQDALVMLAANYPDSDVFDADMQFVPREIKPQQRSLKSVVTFGLLGDEGE